MAGHVAVEVGRMTTDNKCIKKGDSTEGKAGSSVIISGQGDGEKHLGINRIEGFSDL